MHFVTVRKTMGGPNVDEMSATLADARTSMAREADFAQSSRGSLVHARERLFAALRFGSPGELKAE